jgi:hypothetical protein
MDTQKKLHLPFVLALAAPFLHTSAQTSSPAVPVAEGRKYGSLPLTFEANQGQTDPSVQYLAHGQGYTLFLRRGGAVLTASSSPAQSAQSTRQVIRQVIRMDLDGSNPHSAATNLDPQITRSNYFLGNDPTRWHTNIPNYGRVRYADVYPGIDLIYYGNQRQLEYDFAVAPGASADVIRLRFSADAHLGIAPNGDLILTPASGSSSGWAAFHKPVAYQLFGSRRVPVEARFHLAAERAGGTTVGFTIGRYDHSRPLIVDPVLVYSTYLGGSGFKANYPSDQGNGIAVDSAGNAYIVGSTASSDFPTTSGAFQATNTAVAANPGNTTVFISKLNPSGTALVYSTYLGGSGTPQGGDFGYGIALDASGDAYVTGATYSTDFPTTCDSLQNVNYAAPNVTTTGFVAELNPTGSGLVYSTYLGGSGVTPPYVGLRGAGDVAQAIAVNAAGNAYVTGYTYSTDFPFTESSFQTANTGAGSNPVAFVTELNPSGTGLVYSTFLGGSGGDYGNALALDSAGDVFIAGTTSSTNFPVSSGALYPALAGSSDAFVTELNPTGTAEVYSSYLGGTQSDSAQAIAVDSAGNAYVAGNTQSGDFPVTAGVIEGSSFGANSGYLTGFVARFSPNGTALSYSTHIGGHDTTVRGIAVDSAGDAYLTGVAGTLGAGGFGGFQPTPDALATPKSQSDSAFVIKLDPAASVLQFATLLGGSSGDSASGLALDSAGNAYIVGAANSTDFPTTTGAFQTVNQAAAVQGNNATVTKFALASEANTTTYPAFPTDLGTYIVINSAVVTLSCLGDWNMSVDANAYSNQLGPPLNGTLSMSGPFDYSDTAAIQGSWGNIAEGFLSGGGNMYPTLNFTASYSGDPIYQSSTVNATATQNPGCENAGLARNNSAKTNKSIHTEVHLNPVAPSVPSPAKFTPAAAPLSGRVQHEGARVARPAYSPQTTPTAACIAPTASAPYTLSTRLLSFIGETGSPNPAVKTFTVSASGATAPGWVAAKTQPWLKLNRTSGPTPVTVTASVNLTGLTPGEYEDFISITAPGSQAPPVVIKVSLFVHAPYPAAQPSFSLPGGYTDGFASLKITDSTPNAVIYYTIGKTAPTDKSSRYLDPILLTGTPPDEGGYETVNAIAYAPGYAPSSVQTVTYFVTLPYDTPPTFTPAGGAFIQGQTVWVKMADTASGSSIYYTTDGSRPTPSSTKYTGEIPIKTTTTLNAIATLFGHNSSQTTTAVFNFYPQAKAPSFSPAAGSFTAPQFVKISAPEAGTIYYTTDGSTPTNKSTRYTGPVYVKTTETLKAYIVAPSFTPSPVATGTFKILPLAAAPVFTPIAGDYSKPQWVKITDASPGTTIYYTTDGATPTDKSTRYTGQIYVRNTLTFKAIAYGPLWSPSAVATATFTIP